VSVPRRHPTGLAASGAAVLVIVASKAGVDLTAEEAAIVVGFVAALVSRFTPRHPPVPVVPNVYARAYRLHKRSQETRAKGGDPS